MRRRACHQATSIAVYPGSFDPVTEGHLNVLERALYLFDHVVVLVAHNPKKPSGMFSPVERMRLIRRATASLDFGGTSPFGRDRGSRDWPRGVIAWGKDEREWGDEEYGYLFAPGLDPAKGASLDDAYVEIFPHTDAVTGAWLKRAATVDFCEAVGARAMIRGLRSVTDFDQEFELAVANMELAEGVETVFLVPKPENHFVSSSKVREIFSLRGAAAVSRYVPAAVHDELQRREKEGGR